MVKRSKVGGVVVDVTEENVLKTSIPREAYVSIQNKEEVFEGLAHFTAICERNNPTNANEKELYSTCGVDEFPLDTYRLQDRPAEEETKAKEEIAKGLVTTLFLVSQGRVYDILLNPLNFVYNTKKRKVKAFIRKDKPLAEITDGWLYDVKKLIGFYLVQDSGLRVEDFEELSMADIEKYMVGNTLEGFQKIKSANSVGEMAEMLLTEQELRPLATYPPIVKPYVLPKDVTTGKEIKEVKGSAQALQNLETTGGEDEKTEGKGGKKKTKPKREDAPKTEGKHSTAKVAVAFAVGIVAGLLVNKFLLPAVFGVTVSGWWG